jgi:hypothetical protein
LGDKYRSSTNDPGTIPLRYPITLDNDDLTNWASLAVADATVQYVRKISPPQYDLGTLYCTQDLVWNNKTMENGCDWRAWEKNVTIYTGLEHRQEIFTFSGAWTTTGD